jgi:arginyl-tRNA--protein-N-Asp/Glu arginylyltransferase
MEQIKGEILDNYLSKGFYRWNRTIFTDNVCSDSINERMVDVFWLRTNLSKLGNLKDLSIYKKNKKFTVSISDSFIDEEVEELYQRYRANLKFEPSETVDNCLNGRPEIVPLAEFHTKTIQIRDGNKLIAASYFDIGKLTIMDNTNFYDPTYKKYSLSKYMMLLKMELGLNNKMQFYYPGYIALNSTIFDYKIFPTEVAMEVYIPDDDQWYPYTKFGKEGLAPYGFYINFSFEDFMNEIESKE